MTGRPPASGEDRSDIVAIDTRARVVVAATDVAPSPTEPVPETLLACVEGAAFDGGYAAVIVTVVFIAVSVVVRVPVLAIGAALATVTVLCGGIARPHRGGGVRRRRVWWRDCSPDFAARMGKA